MPISTAPPKRTTTLNTAGTTLSILTENRSPTLSITGTTTSTVLHVQGDREVHSAGEALLSDTRVLGTTLSDGDLEDLIAHPTMCMTAAPKHRDSKALPREKALTVAFDHVSFDILIDNCASVSITNQLKDLFTPQQNQKQKLLE